MKIEILSFGVRQTTYKWVNALVVDVDISFFAFAFRINEMFVFGKYRFYAHDEISKDVYTNHSECNPKDLKSHRKMVKFII